VVLFSHQTALSWNDETHIAIAKAAGYKKWYHAAGADMVKLKLGRAEAQNHYVNNPPNTIITPQMVMAQVDHYNRIDGIGHLYGAIIHALRDYEEAVQAGRYGAYYLSFCAHYVGDLTQPLHHISYTAFNEKYHRKFDGIINHDVLEHIEKIKIYPIRIASEKDLAKEIARIANLAMKLVERLESENRMLTKQEAYEQISHSASLFGGILDFISYDRQ
jgi:S1/P1 nuclease